MKENGMKIWQGPSVLTGDMIMAVITGLKLKSKNPKTDDMYQLWILLVDEAPHHATKSGRDEAVCGRCPLRPFLKAVRPKHLTRPCYVKTYQAPRSVWKAYKDEPVTPLEEARLRLGNKSFRYGAYGDWAAVPKHVANEWHEGVVV